MVGSLAVRRIATTAIVVMAIVAVAFVPVNAQAGTDIVIEDETSCSTVGGSWTDNTCTVESPTPHIELHNDDELVIAEGVTLALIGVLIETYDTSTVTNNGRIDFYRLLEENIIRTARISTWDESTFINNGRLDNADNWLGQVMQVHGDSAFINHGSVTLAAATIGHWDSGSTENYGYIGAETVGVWGEGSHFLNAVGAEVWGQKFSVFGVADNFGTITSVGGLNIELGTLNNHCGGVVIGTIFSGEVVDLCVTGFPELVAIVQALELSSRLEPRLLAKVEAAEAASDDGKIAVAIRKLNGFIRFVSSAVDEGKMETADGDALVAAANALIASLSETS